MILIAFIDKAFASIRVNSRIKSYVPSWRCAGVRQLLGHFKKFKMECISHKTNRLVKHERCSGKRAIKITIITI